MEASASCASALGSRTSSISKVSAWCSWQKSFVIRGWGDKQKIQLWKNHSTDESMEIWIIQCTLFHASLSHQSKFGGMTQQWVPNPWRRYFHSSFNLQYNKIQWGYARLSKGSKWLYGNISNKLSTSKSAPESEDLGHIRTNSKDKGFNSIYHCSILMQHPSSLAHFARANPKTHRPDAVKPRAARPARPAGRAWFLSPTCNGGESHRLMDQVLTWGTRMEDHICHILIVCMVETRADTSLVQDLIQTMDTLTRKFCGCVWSCCKKPFRVSSHAFKPRAHRFHFRSKVWALARFGLASHVSRVGFFFWNSKIQLAFLQKYEI